jgi:hypothetical protein
MSIAFKDVRTVEHQDVNSRTIDKMHDVRSEMLTHLSSAQHLNKRGYPLPIGALEECLSQLSTLLDSLEP